MTHTEVSEWFEQNLKSKQREFGVPHFRITIKFDRLEDEAWMCCEALPDYERATITVDDARYHASDVAVLESDFEHELMHVVHSPFELFRQTALNLMDESNWKALTELNSRCCEMVVRNMERMTYGLRDSLTAKHRSDFEAVCAERDALQAKLDAAV